MPNYRSRRSLSKKRREEIEKQLQDRFKKTERTGMSARLLRGEDVESYFTQFSEETNKNIDAKTAKKTNELTETLSKRTQAILNYLEGVIQKKIDSFPVPKDGRTPTEEEVSRLIAPMVEELSTKYDERVKSIEELLKVPQTEIPQDLKGLEDFVKKVTPKVEMGGGSGPGYFFELLDVPKKSKGFQGAYAEYKNKVLSVSSDGKKLEWKTPSGGSGGGTWGSITGTLSDQTDLQTALNAKATINDTVSSTSSTYSSSKINSLISSSGDGDMLASVYDPGGIAANAFDYNNFINKPTIPTNNNQLTNGAGYVLGPASSTDNTVPIFDGVTGKILKQSPISFNSGGDMILADGKFLINRNSGNPEFDFSVGGVVKSKTYWDATNSRLVFQNNENNNQDALFFSDHVTTAGNITVGGNISATNLSGVNTGDQDLSGYQLISAKGVANGYASLGADGKIPTSQLNPLAITSTSVVASQAAQIALTAQEGDVAIRTDENKSYVQNGGTTGTMSDWTELLTPTDAVQSVNGYTGAITLTTSDIAEGTNLYYTNTRVQTYGDANYLKLSGGTLTGELGVNAYVGIGNTTPSTNLDVIGGVNGRAAIKVKAAASSADLMQFLNNSGAEVFNLNTDGGNEPYLEFKNSAGDLLMTMEGVNSRVTFQNVKLGIGTTTPNYDLDVNGSVNAKTVTFETEFDNGNSDDQKTIDLTMAQKQRITLTGNATIYFTGQLGAGNFVLKLIQDATGGRTPTFPIVKWAGGTAPTFSTAAGAVDIISLYYDGVSLYGMAGLNFA